MRRIDYPGAERLALRLSSALRDQLGPELSTLPFVPIPRGGLFVLGMLSYALDLSPSQIRTLDAPATGPSAGSGVVLVDDCALSGARLAGALDRIGAGEGRVVVAHLLSHPDLRRAVEAAEPRVARCLAADDLSSLEGAFPEDFDVIWRGRLPGRRYRVVPVEPVAFPWSEPEAVWWNARDGLLERGWHRVSPRSCLRFRAELRLPEPRDAPGPLDLAGGVLWKLDGDRVLLRAADRTGRLIGLGGVALDMWKSLIAYGDRERAAEHLSGVYDVARADLERDLDALLQDLLGRGFLVRPAGGGRAAAS
ncbi:MAG: PqqD family peptide modification chaperone [Acidobacteriota bacterium]